jgi:phage FluMu gp28-like protein
MLRPPTVQAPDRSSETLERYRRALPDREWRALEAWASTFYPCQRAWVFEPARRAICCSSRQYGKSHGTAAAGVAWGAFHGELTTIISKGEVESVEVLDKVVKHATVLERLGSRMAKLKSRSATHVRFASGGRVLAAPSTGGRGFTGNLFLDELAYHEHAEQTWDAALPVTLRSGHRVRIASTPNGVGNLFHGLWTDPAQHSGFARHEIPLLTAIGEGLDVDLEHCWALAKGDRRLFDQIFNCSFIDGEQQYIPTDYVTRAANGELYCLGGENFAGLDIGREHDLTALVVVNWDGVIARVVAIRTAKRTDHDALLALAGHAVKHHRVRRLCVDQTGIGAFPVEEMQRAWGRQRVEGVTFGLGSKEEMATTLHGAFAGEWLRIPRDDTEIVDVDQGNARGLIEDVCSLRRIVTTAGNIRYDAARGADGHADRAWALALALHAITNRPATRHVRFGGAEQDAEQPWQT